MTTLAIDQKVRDEVRAFYERHPYPPPDQHLDDYRDHRRMLSGSPAYFFHQYWPRRAFRDDLDVLVAGCGTSQAAKYAIQQPNLRVTGIDICSASLAQQRQWKDRYGLDNLTLREVPIEEVSALDQSFDLVLSTGVLHHLADPATGLRALREVLRPDGAMHLGVYAPYGRIGISLLKSYCRRLGIDPTDAELADLVGTIGALPPGHPLDTFMSYGDDLTSPGAVADALLHPNDRTYSVSELYDWIEHCGIRFTRWQHQASYLPSCGRPASSPHAERLAALPPRDQHAALELLRGTMILHAFVACRDDRPKADCTVDFEAPDAPKFVPSRFEGAEAVDAALPEGAALILRNRAHRDLDLALPLSAAAARLCAAIDGERTIEEIARRSELIDPPEQVLAFAIELFQMMWRHDLIQVRLPLETCEDAEVSRLARRVLRSSRPS